MGLVSIYEYVTVKDSLIEYAPGFAEFAVAVAIYPKEELELVL